MGRAITKDKAIKGLHLSLGPGTKFKAIEWIKLPEKGRLLIYEMRSRDIFKPHLDQIETRYRVIPGDGGGSGGTLGTRTVRRVVND